MFALGSGRCVCVYVCCVRCRCWIAARLDNGHCCEVCNCLAGLLLLFCSFCYCLYTFAKHALILTGWSWCARCTQISHQVRCRWLFLISSSENYWNRAIQWKMCSFENCLKWRKAETNEEEEKKTSNGISHKAKLCAEYMALSHRLRVWCVCEPTVNYALLWTWVCKFCCISFRFDFICFDAGFNRHFT